ncbi:baseplate J/gp47 family protein [Chitinimonas taiwanensis]|uniref:Baseplate J-like protein n=1 Tax=Chitinimonas taiwanensis DSM 18899 TaxID=1121279 RepID=A0A1K2HRV2_9NEIS|nr:baseplate J/gp47 family protein [Chitinimonas taiwanensis]SFZ79536.1 Baseplate J-like protein [Chitinimonas taiwanensis DSM 18899]
MQHGTQQDQRLAAALQAGYVLPDELSLVDRLRLSLAQAASLRFGRSTQSWASVLGQDEAVQLAELASLPLPRLQADFLAALDWQPETTLWQQLWQLVQRYDGWCQQLLVAESAAGKALGQALLTQIEQGLAGLLARCIQLFGHPGGQLHPSWARHGLAQMAHWQAQVGSGKSDAGQAKSRRDLLRRAWLAISQAIARQQGEAQRQFERSLHSGRHDPAMGLLLSSLQLYQHSRAPLNRFPERLIEFYYRDLLRLQPRPAASERVHLLLEREPRFNGAVSITPGMRFLGGKDAQGQTLEFAADSGLELSQTRVSALYTLRSERDPLISPEREFDYATRLKVEALPLLAPEAAYAARPPWWPLLGGQAKGSSAQAQDAELGLAIASPLLILKEGRRELRLRVQLAHPADQDGVLQQALRQPAAKRTPAWLATVYARYAAYEQQHFPPRPRPGPPEPISDPASLAEAAWQRATQFQADVQLSYLLARCLACRSPDYFAERLGRLFAAWLQAREEDLRPVDLAALRAHAAQLRGEQVPRRVEIDDPLILIYPPREGSAIQPDRTLIFGRVLADAWEAKLSTASGWLTLDKVFMRRHQVEAGNPRCGGSLELVLRLGAEQAAIVPCQPAVHGALWPAQAVLQLRLQTRSRLYAYSLLQQYQLLELNLSVAVRGLRDVVLYNQLGRLDPSKPFQPFGPAPTAGSYLLLGSPELACKPLQALQLQLKWSDLPSARGGMAEHYAGYPGEWRSSAFLTRPQVLVDGQWCQGMGSGLALFSEHAGSGRLQANQRLNFPPAELRRLHRASPPLPAEQPFLFGLNSRNGFFRFDLSEPAQAFGHALYPGLLSAVLTRNARSKQTTKLPLEPYTPKLESLTLNYQASQDLPLSAEPAKQRSDGLLQRVYHLHPFGLLEIGRQGSTTQPSLLPHYQYDGNLYIGLAGEDPQGGLNLFFHLRKEEAAERWLEAAPTLHWASWQAGGWQALRPQQQLADSTQGLLRSGIVQLNLPAGMSTDCDALPEAGYWLRLSADWGFSQLAGLYGVYTHAISASRCTPAGADEGLLPLAPGSVNAPAQSLPGLRSVLQIGPSYGRRPADPDAALRLRAAERLRHKLRAQTSWDYERLLLDAFPEAFKVKCFPHHQASLGDGRGLGQQALDRAPGQVLLVVVPQPQQGSLFHSTDAPHLDAATLDAMQRYLQARAPAGARVLVRNAAYERVQLRASLRLQPGYHAGATLRRLNQLLVEHLSPWHTQGLGADFDWTLRAETLEALLRQQAEVAQLSQLSLLHIVRNDQSFHALRDTTTQASRQLRPAQPWSLLLPVRQHLLELLDEATPLRSVPTGITRLEVGSTFIVGRGISAEASQA